MHISCMDIKKYIRNACQTKFNLLYINSFSELSQGWTLYEILRYAPEHNWIAYEEALKSNPVLSKMVISGVVYSVGDWIAQVRVPLCFRIVTFISDYLNSFMFMVFTVLRGEASF